MTTQRINASGEASISNTTRDRLRAAVQTYKTAGTLSGKGDPALEAQEQTPAPPMNPAASAAGVPVPAPSSSGPAAAATPGMPGAPAVPATGSVPAANGMQQAQVAAQQEMAQQQQLQQLQDQAKQVKQQTAMAKAQADVQKAQMEQAKVQMQTQMAAAGGAAPGGAAPGQPAPAPVAAAGPVPQVMPQAAPTKLAQVGAPAVPQASQSGVLDLQSMTRGVWPGDRGYGDKSTKASPKLESMYWKWFAANLTKDPAARKMEGPLIAAIRAERQKRYGDDSASSLRNPYTDSLEAEQDQENYENSVPPQYRKETWRDLAGPLVAAVGAPAGLLGGAALAARLGATADGGGIAAGGIGGGAAGLALGIGLHAMLNRKGKNGPAIRGSAPQAPAPQAMAPKMATAVPAENQVHVPTADIPWTRKLPPTTPPAPGTMSAGMAGGTATRGALHTGIHPGINGAVRARSAGLGLKGEIGTLGAKQGSLLPSKMASIRRRLATAAAVKAASAHVDPTNKLAFVKARFALATIKAARQRAVDFARDDITAMSAVLVSGVDPELVKLGSSLDNLSDTAPWLVGFALNSGGGGKLVDMINQRQHGRSREVKVASGDVAAYQKVLEDGIRLDRALQKTAKIIHTGVEKSAAGDVTSWVIKQALRICEQDRVLPLRQVMALRQDRAERHIKAASSRVTREAVVAKLEKVGAAALVSNDTKTLAKCVLGLAAEGALGQSAFCQVMGI